MSDTGAAAGTGAPAGGSLDSLVDSAFGAMEADGLLEGLEGAGEPGKVKAKPKADPEQEEPQEGAGEGEEPELELEGEEGDEEADTRGTREDPISVKDLPEDRFIKLKIDGREETVSLRELGDGYIREQTFRGKLKEIKDVPTKIDALVQEFGEKLTGQRGRVNKFLSDPEKLFEFYTQSDETEAVGMELAKRFAQLAAAEKANPLAKQQRQLARKEAQLEQQRREHERTTRERDEQRQASEAAQRRRDELKPAWEDALKESGFPKPTSELYELVNVNVTAQAKKLGRPVSPAEFKAIALRAIKFLDLKPGGNKPAPAPKPTKTPEERKKPTKNPHKRGSVDSLIFGLKPGRF